MAIDETKLPEGALGTEGEDSLGAQAAPLYSVDDLRMRLDAPLFHRDAGMSAAQAPQLRELTWEHVVRPPQTSVDHENAEKDVLSMRAAVVADTASIERRTIEALLADACGTVEPSDFIAPLRPAAPVELLEGLSVEVPVLEVPVLEVPVLEATVVERPVAARRPSQALYTIDDDGEVVPVSSPAPRPRVEMPATAMAPLDDGDDDLAVAPSLEPALPEQGEVVDEGQAFEKVTEPLDEAVGDSEATAVSPVAVAQRVAQPVGPRPAPKSTVEAELNRLAFLPDQEDDAGPVAVPPISFSNDRSAAVPSLSQHQMYTARPSAPPRVSMGDAPTTFVPATRKKKKKHFLVRLVTFLVIVGVLAGASYAGKYYFLDKRWEDEVKTLASDVEEARGLSFDHAITVTTLPVTEYAAKLVTVSLGLGDEEMATQAGEWRALGVLTGQLDVEQIGMAALPDSPAFYDPASETIFVADAMPEDLYRFGMHRALAMALLDQRFGWSARIEDVSPTIVRGTRAYYDADALATAVSIATPKERTDIVTQIFGLYGTYQIATSPSPFASIVAGRLGVALRPYLESIPTDDRAAQENTAAFTDGQVLDVRRLTAGVVESPAIGSRGMLFWYHVMAGRINENTAWDAALAWQNDDVQVVDNPAGACVVAHLQVDQASLESVTAALQGWAAAAPTASGTTVTLTTDGSPMQLQINACDPGAGVPTTSGVGYLALGGAPLRAEQYRLLIEAQPTLPPTQVACAVFGADPVSMADERGVMDNAEGWPAPANHPLPDPNRLACVPA